jgi:hypothetical protein
MYFRGLHKVKEQWDDDAWEEKCAEAYSSAIDLMFEDACDFANSFGPRMARKIMKELITDIKDIEKTYNFLKNREIDSEDIEYVLTETDDYFSDRHMDKCEWLDEPVKETVTQYPKRKNCARGGKRCRALEDEFAVINFIIIM